MAAFTYTNSNSVLDNGATFSNPEASNPITVAEEALVLNSSGKAISDALVLENGSYQVTVNGTVGSEVGGGVGIVFDTAGSGSSKLTVGETGIVYGDSIGVLANDATTITNSGMIEGGLFAIQLSADGTCTITNNLLATISSGDVVAISISGNGVHTIVNNGDILGSIDASYEPSTGTSVQKITNKGLIDGSILLGAGDDQVTNSAAITGMIDVGGGKNKITNSGIIAMITASGETSATTLTNTGTVAGAVILGDGDNVITNSKTIENEVELGIGNDKVTNSGLIGFGLSLGDGHNTLKNTGTIEYLLSMGGGNDSITNSGTLTGFDMSGGDNTLNNTATIWGPVESGSGTDKVTNGGTIGGLLLSSGLNVVQNTGKIAGDVTGLEDADQVTNSGTIEGDVSLGDGVNAVTSSGRILGGVFGEGVATITNSGTIEGIVSLGDGADVLKNSGTIKGDIFLGAGNDQLTGGNGAELIYDEAGTDTYKLGGGDDDYFAFADPEGEPTGDDTVDGGLGIDTYWADSPLDPVTVNLNATAVAAYDNPLTLYAAKSATDGADGLIGKDTIAGFENVVGGVGGDTLIGNEFANELSGGDGDDTLYGLAGNDKLWGEVGGDVLYGGRGRDTLTGSDGENSDGEFGNTFLYTSVKDSTLAVSGRDLITDFDDGFDVIDFSRISDAPAGFKDADWNFIGVNTKWTQGDTGQVRAQSTAKGWLVVADVNGDTKSDFAIEVADADHSIAWSADDFRFTDVL